MSGPSHALHVPSRFVSSLNQEDLGKSCTNCRNELRPAYSSRMASPPAVARLAPLFHHELIDGLKGLMYC